MIVREVAPEEYLDRQRRMLRARGKVDGHLDPQAMQAILREVVPLELVEGRSYRIRVLGGEPALRPFHAVEAATGRHVVGELPDVSEPMWLEIEGLYIGRGSGSLSASLLFHMGGGRLAALADMDVLRIEDLSDQEGG